VIFDATYRLYTEVLTWSGAFLTQKDYYTSGDTGTKIWQADYTWSGSSLSQKDIQYVPVSSGYSISYTWSGDYLERKDREVYPL